MGNRNLKFVTTPANSPFARHLDDGTPNGVPYISPSQVGKISLCPKDWDYTYLQGMPEEMSIAATFGVAAHEVLEEALEQHNNGSKIDIDELQNKAYDATLSYYTDPDNLANLRDRDEVDPEELAQEMRQCIKAIWKWFLNSGMQVVGVEGEMRRKFVVNGQKVILLGYYDFYAKDANGKYHLIDWKFTGSAPKAQPFDKTKLMAKINYYHACLSYSADLIDNGKPVDYVTIVHIVRNKKGPTVKVAQIEVTPERTQWADYITENTIQLIQSRTLTPNPLGAGWKCSEKFCAHWKYCPASAYQLQKPSTQDQEEEPEMQEVTNE